MLKCYVKDLIEDVAKDYPTIEAFYKNFAKNADIGYHVVLRVLEAVIQWYDLRRPAFRRTVLPNVNAYEFKDNFQEFLDGNIPEELIELVPTAIIRVGTYGAWTSANYWDYREPVLYGGTGASVEYTHRRKIVCKQAPDDWFTEDSAVYFLEKWDEDLKTLFNQTMGKVINEAKKSVNFGGVEFLSYLDSLLPQLEQDVKRSEASDLVLMRLWRQ